MNAAIDQQCEKYIIENDLWEQVNDYRTIRNGNLPRYSVLKAGRHAPTGQLEGVLACPGIMDWASFAGFERS